MLRVDGVTRRSTILLVPYLVLIQDRTKQGVVVHQIRGGRRSLRKGGGGGKLVVVGLTPHHSYLYTVEETDCFCQWWGGEVFFVCVRGRMLIDEGE